MGRHAGYIALWCGICNGSEDVLLPEKGKVSTKQIISNITANRKKGKKHHLIIVAEGVGGTEKLAREIEEKTGIETRATILGHLQRGGSPTAVDRMHGSMMGAYAVDLLCEGKSNRVVAYKDGKYVDFDIEEGRNMVKVIDDRKFQVSQILDKYTL